ncbi:aldehyde dehydrogenase family protein [Streptomyces sp. NPDC055037]
MSNPRMSINGRSVPAERTFDVIDPATGEVFAQAPDCTPEQLDQAMTAAAAAFPAWRRDENARRDLLRLAAARLQQEAPAIAALLTSEQGKPLQEAHTEVYAAAWWLTYYADLEVAREVVQDTTEGFAEVVRRPLGVVAAITPWNVPLTLAMWKLAPALRAGNTVVVKPSPYTPLSTLAMGEIFQEVFPAGVVNVVSGLEPLGALMTSHPVPRKISFTGSTPTGKLIAAAAAPDLKRLTLELGGNDPAIILDDADPAAIADELFWGAFQNSGQICLAVKRVYAPRSLQPALVEALAERAKRVRVGRGTDENVEMGPLNNLPQYERVKELVTDALSHGATAAAGGHPLDGPGYFYAPTILTDVSDGMRIVDEEQFGPALPVLAYDRVEDALASANASPYGLTASVWSADVERAMALATELECGMVSVNAHGSGARPDLPFGGAKWSGIGVENGIWGLHSFSEPQTLTHPGMGS